MLVSDSDLSRQPASLARRFQILTSDLTASISFLCWLPSMSTQTDFLCAIPKPYPVSGVCQPV